MSFDGRHLSCALSVCGVGDGIARLVHFNLAWPCRPPINNENEHQSQPLVCAKWRYWGAQKIFRNNATEHPTAEWTLQQLREALPGDQDYKFLLHDRHKTFSAGLDEEIERWGLEVLK